MGNNNRKKGERIYLDCASGTPVDARVLKAMMPYLGDKFANPSALYVEGVEAKIAIEKSREKVARTIGCRAEEIIFTSGGTESDNLAILGVFDFFKKSKTRSPHIITSVIEHPAILEVCRELERRGGRVTYLPVDSLGHISLEKLKKAITKDTCLVTLAYANSEIGTVNPIRKISAIVKNNRTQKNSAYPFLHIDAGQTPLFFSMRPNDIGVDLLTLDGAKIYGPKGGGALFARRTVPLLPIIFGGAQESGRRAGTENVPAIVGFAEALRLAIADQKKESKRLFALRDYFIKNILSAVPGSILNGDSEDRLPNNSNFYFPGISGEFALIKLDTFGIACSSAASCRTLTNESYSYVIEALGKRNCAESSLRFTFGKDTTKKDVDQAVEILREAVGK